MSSSQRRQDKTVLSVSAVWTELETSQDCRRQRTFRNWTCLVFCSFVLSWNAGLNKTVQSQIYWGLLKTVLTCRQFSSHADAVKTRQSCLVLSMSAVWTRHNTWTDVVYSVMLFAVLLTWMLVTDYWVQYSPLNRIPLNCITRLFEQNVENQNPNVLFLALIARLIAYHFIE